MVEPIVEISDGKLKGTIRKNYKGEDFYAFLGIPFAKPPVGELRFKDPVPAEPWDGIKDASQDGNQCFQFDLITSKTGGSEDCLFLNVFTKNLSESSTPKPVLVFIHGGAFTMGSNNSNMYSPNFLMTEDIVFVSTNYRLGILGFLKLNDLSLGVPGNAGLKDQLLALKWVQKNIKNFGGDPNNVTIYGESAGAASVNYHVLSPASKGHFHKAIIQSGSVLNPWPHLNPNSIDAIKFIKAECKDEAEMLDALINAPVEKLIEAQLKLSMASENNKLRSFAPCVEAPHKTAFLFKNPIDVITSGDYNKVPMMIGCNSNEGLMIALEELNPAAPRNPKITYEKFIPSQMDPVGSETRDKICEKLKTVYSDDRPGDRFLLAGDALFVAGIIAFTENVVKTSPEPLYFHILSLESSRNAMKRLTRTQEPGVCHADDLGYVFDSDLPIPTLPHMQKIPIVPGSIEDIGVTRYIRLFGNFVKYGNPTPDQSEFGLTWKPVTKSSFPYLDFDKELSMKTNPNEERIRVWKEIYKMHENTKNFVV